MQAKLKAKIIEVKKYGGNATLSLRCEGKVMIPNTNAQGCLLEGTLVVKELVANQMKIGANITIAISDEEVSE